MTYSNTLPTNNNFDSSCIFQAQNGKIFKERLNIMIIDDNKRDIELFEDLLGSETGLQFHLSKWTNAHEAINSLESGYISKPDLIVLDLVMPSINGFMALNQIKEVAEVQSIPVVIHSSMRNLENHQEAARLKAAAFFTKPLDTGMFRAFVMGEKF